MNAQKTQELNDWIAERVFRWKRGKMYGNGNGEWNLPDGSICYWNSTPRYTTDPAAAMEVLKKCIEKISKRAIEPLDDSDFETEFSIMLRLGYEDKGGFALRGLRTWFDTYSADELAESETIELAICFLAKELFSK